MVWLALVMGCSSASAPPAPADGGRAALEAARAALADGRPEAARDLLEPAVEALPEDPLLRGVLAHAWLELDQVEPALVHGKLAVGLDPTLAEAAWNVACAYARLGDKQAAVLWLRRALQQGDFTTEDVRAEPDFAGLEDDHRVAVYLSTGVLSRAEEDVIALVDRHAVSTGEEVMLSLALLQLNRTPLAATRATLGRGQDGGLDGFEILERRETLVRGEAGGSEYVQRTLHFTLRALRPGAHVLGPFRVDGDDGVHWTTPQLVAVDGDPVAPSLGPAPGFFALPSLDDEPLVADADAWDGGEVAPLQGTRVLLYRTPTLELAPELPPRPDGARRSTWLRRSTEGPSWTVDRE